eukprot:5896866-Heterocapsa_arctica.AAC.1
MAEDEEEAAEMHQCFADVLNRMAIALSKKGKRKPEATQVEPTQRASRPEQEEGNVPAGASRATSQGQPVRKEAEVEALGDPGPT